MSKTKLFRIALTVEEVTARDWARQHDLSETGLNTYLRGGYASARLDEEVGGFIDRALEKLNVYIASQQRQAA